MKTDPTKITENQFWQLVGVITAAKSCRKQMDSLENAYKEITGEKELNRFSDYVYEDNNIIESLKKHLPFDKVTVVWNSEQQTKKGKRQT